MRNALGHMFQQHKLKQCSYSIKIRTCLLLDLVRHS
jgi:hypothetical protein